MQAILTEQMHSTNWACILGFLGEPLSFHPSKIARLFLRAPPAPPESCWRTGEMLENLSEKKLETQGTLRDKERFHIHSEASEEGPRRSACQNKNIRRTLNAFCNWYGLF